MATKVPDPTPPQRRAIDRHLDELDLWNRRLNLTAVPREVAWERHVVESLALLDAAGLRKGVRCADLGSGGGIPGVIVAIVRPDLAVTLIESDQRKAGFLVHVSGLLGLGNVTVAARRAEEMGADPAHRGRYDAVLSRAAAPPPLLCVLSMPLLTTGGTLWALVAAADAAAAVGVLEGDPAVRAERPAPGIFAVQKIGDAGSAG
ncbi:MAG: 16S rRNA (guanine(527)-N(7))-methyltransferase RsmG [Candidatus Dormibacteraeota bacterium]|uniref:Ribosomal RNA small subunit methyltransferase G n=1 Tax=Candidatus Aeolococcus gillhamiae TaxID=3127015 RepID=A0A934JS08_9BACT|nr:16S rRNA (guanine(527)-N(7))-methyltransferase RsmG [Candidatus Dormibacteraeota bacterium]